jgi:carbamoyl-phosphate synthase small subunit
MTHEKPSDTDKWHWREKRKKTAFLALEDGTVLQGHSVGAHRDAMGEVVFNTGMSGYQEILSDPSYHGQFVTMTYPEMGNTGINAADQESRCAWANGFIVHQFNEPSNWRASHSLGDYLKRWNIPALAGIDTRGLTTRLRDRGTLKASLVVTGSMGIEQAINKARKWSGLDGKDYVTKVTCEEQHTWDNTGSLTCSWGIAEQLPPADLNIVAYDLGIKWNILRSLRLSGMHVTVVPATTSAETVLGMHPDGIFFSNGPGDPAAIDYAVEAARKLIGRIPMMGICLGHQILGLALGAKTYRLKFGHHGCNHPVMDLATRKVEITSQNHNFALDHTSLDTSVVDITHINLNDQTVEGIQHKHEPVFSIQYHPEACPGPHDPFHLFTRFRDLMKKGNSR